MATDNTYTGSTPPPYNTNHYPQYPPHYGDGTERKDRTTNIAVISPAGNMGVPEDQPYDMPPPDYAQGTEDFNCFSDASIRRGLDHSSLSTIWLQI